jgi:acyl carrier protein
MSENITEKVIGIIAKFKNVPVENVTLDTALADLGMDSLDGLNLIFELEEEFNLTVPDDRALQMKTVKDIVEGMERLLAAETVS